MSINGTDVPNEPFSEDVTQGVNEGQEPVVRWLEAECRSRMQRAQEALELHRAEIQECRVVIGMCEAALRCKERTGEDQSEAAEDLRGDLGER